MAWFYRCEEQPDVEAEDDCPVRFWKDTSGRYMDRAAVKALLKDGVTPVLDGFAARNGRTYKGIAEIDREEWKVVVRSQGWNEEGTNDQPEYEVNTDPLGRCPICDDHDVVETPTQYLCEERLKEEERREKEGPPKRGEKKPKVCGFVFPRTVCKREITRDEAQHYMRESKTELLEDFTSRFGRPFSATLVLKENGRHGFEFPPRKPRGGAAGEEAAGTKKKTTRKKKKKATGAKVTRKKKTTRKKAAARTATRKKATRKKTATRKSVRKKASSTTKPKKSPADDS